MDATTAFLNAPLDEPKLMRIPEGLHLDRTKYACRHNRAIYMLWISPRLWYLTMGKTLTELQLMQSIHEPCLFYAVSGEKFVLLALYVDDLLITGTDTDRINDIHVRLKQIYIIKDLGVEKKIPRDGTKQRWLRGTIDDNTNRIHTGVSKNIKLK